MIARKNEDLNGRDSAKRFLIGQWLLLVDMACLAQSAECDAGATETRPCQSGAEHVRLRLQQLQQAIEQRNGHLVVVVQAGVGRSHQLTECLDYLTE